MGITKQQAAENKDTILRTAERLFRTKGIDAVGISELMAEAGFTQGGFYNHFESKDALVKEVMERALRQGSEEMDEAISHSQSLGKNPLERQIHWYLSNAQRDDVICGCPLAALAGDVSRLGKTPVDAYGEGLKHTFDTFQSLLKEDNPSLTSRNARRRAIELFSSMVGAVVLSRAVHPSNPALADEILSKAREATLEQVRSNRQDHGSKAER